MDARDLATRIARATCLPVAQVGEVARALASARLTDAEAVGVRRLLADSGVGVAWNRALNEGRARYLASRLRALLPGGRPRILDVLSGTGTVAAELRCTGCEVVEAERLSQYPGRAATAAVIDLESEPDRVGAVLHEGVDAVLVITSLHHEPDLDRMLGWLGSLGAPQLIVVENLLTDDTDADHHARFDWFFNSCLNEFGAECPGWYWRRGQWLQLLSSLGRAEWLYQCTDVPGIPFPYDFFRILRGPVAP